jgi:dTDP-4-amino-4,6-dideoxygalactose transaminase
MESLIVASFSACQLRRRAALSETSGSVMCYQIPWGRPTLADSELAAVSGVFRSGWLTMGPQTRAFEEKMSSFVGQRFGVGVSNGTVALDVALKSIGITQGDEIIVPAMAFIAVAACVLYQQATPVFVDIERRTFNLDVDLVEQSITPRTKAVVFMDFGGHPADLAQLRGLADERGLLLVEDAAQSLGAVRDGIRCGAAGHVNTTSFHAAKPVSTVEGGMVFTDMPELAEKARMIRNHGESAKYIHDLLGGNFRMTDLSAAIGLVQFSRLEEHLAQRRRLAERYVRNLRGDPGIGLQQVESGVTHSWFLFLVLVESRDRVVEHLTRKGIETRITYPLPLNRQKVFREFAQGRYPNAEWFSERVVSLPMFVGLTDEEIDYVCETLADAVRSVGS